MSDDNHWKIDRRIPLAVIMTFVLQVVGAVIWATELDARVSNVERQNINSEGTNEKFARLEERLENMKQDLALIRHQLDHVTDHLLGK